MHAYEQLVGSAMTDRGSWFKVVSVASADLAGAPGFAPTL